MTAGIILFGIFILLSLVVLVYIDYLDKDDENVLEYKIRKEIKRMSKSDWKKYK